MRGHDDDDDDDDDDDALSLCVCVCGYLRLNCKFVWVVSAIKKMDIIQRQPLPGN